jgi:hypothetical protein
MLGMQRPVPRQEFADLIDRVIGDAGKNVAQPHLWIKTVELRRLDQGVDGSGTLAAGIGAREQVILSAESEWPDGAFGGVVVDLQAAVLEVAGERCPACESIAHSGGEIALAGQFWAAAAENYHPRLRTPSKCVQIPQQQSAAPAEHKYLLELSWWLLSLRTLLVPQSAPNPAHIYFYSHQLAPGSAWPSSERDFP